MATKTVTLTGAELCVDELGGLNALIVNNTDAPLYASAKAGVTPYADGVIEIKAGASRGLPDTNGTVYLLGSGGRAELTGTSAGVNFNVPSQSADGGGITRAEVDGIVTEKIAGVVANAPEDFDTLREIADWIDGHEDSAAAMNSSIKANAADISDIQTEQQTQNSSISALQTEMEQKADLSSVSNPNLLDNPDFKINQRNQTEYTGSSGYCVDRWFRNAGVNVTTTSEGLSFSYVDYTNPTIYQKIPNTKELLGKTLTFSACIEGKIYKCTATLPDTQTSITYLSYARIDGEDVTPTTSDPHIRMQLHTNMGLLLVLSTLSNIQYTKLELGDKATPFISPHPALELLKCQRYLKKLNEFEVFRAAFVHTDYIDFSIPTSVTMPGAVSVLGMPWIYPFPLQLPIVDGFVFTVPVQGQSALRVRAYKTNHGLNDATLMTPDDKMVLLSAEL